LTSLQSPEALQLVQSFSTDALQQRLFLQAPLLAQVESLSHEPPVGVVVVSQSPLASHFLQDAETVDLQHFEPLHEPDAAQVDFSSQSLPVSISAFFAQSEEKQKLLPHLP
jgi:hypothetical protein